MTASNHRTLVVACLAVALAVGAAFPPAGHANTPGPADSLSSSSSIRGEVIVITDEFYLVQDAVGKGPVQVMVSKATKLEQPIRMGDSIVAELSKEGYAVAIKKAK